MLASSVHKHVLHHNDSCIIMVKFNNFLYIVLYLIHYLTCDQEWWDSCAEAGPKTRPQVPFAKAQPALALLAMQNGKLVQLDLFIIALLLQSVSIDRNLLTLGSRWSWPFTFPLVHCS